MKKWILLSTLFATSLVTPGFAETVVYEEAAAPYVLVEKEPPTEIEEIITPTPGENFIWVRGHWRWDNKWVWVKGHWTAKPHPEAIWVPGHWKKKSHHWVWVHGYWE